MHYVLPMAVYMLTHHNWDIQGPKTLLTVFFLFPLQDVPTLWPGGHGGAAGPFNPGLLCSPGCCHKAVRGCFPGRQPSLLAACYAVNGEWEGCSGLVYLQRRMAMHGSAAG